MGMVSNAQKDVLEDILEDLNQQNKRAIDQISQNCVNHHKFKCTADVAQNIFTICSLLSLNDSAKYAAIELFDRFCVKYVCDTKNVFIETRQLSSSADSSSQTTDWSVIETRMSKQMHLRIVSCIAIASKLYCFKKKMDGELRRPVVSMRVAQQLMSRCGHEYSLKDLNKSELRIIKLMNFELMVTTIFTYVETLIAIIDHNMGDQIKEIRVYYKLAKQITDVYYMSRNDIISNCCESLFSGIKLIDEEMNKEKIGANKMLISTAIILSIAAIIDSPIVNLVEQELSEVTEIHGFDMRCMSNAILLSIFDQ